MSFEAGFFGPGNKLRWEAIQAGTLSQETLKRLGPFLSDLSNNAEILALPRVTAEGNVIWYVVCPSPRMTRVARDQVRAFLGPSYSNFDGRLAELNPLDPVEAAVLRKYGRNAFRVSIPDPKVIETARERLRLLLQLRKEQPIFYAKPERAVGRILRDFEYGLLTGDEATLASSLEELRATGRLSPTNLLFLEIRRLAVGRAWDAILTLPELDSLLSLPRPRGVTESIIAAIYHSRLAELVEGDRATEALDVFRSAVFNRFRGAYRSRANLSGFAVDASFVMVAITADPPQRDAANAILGRYEVRSREYGLLRALIESNPQPASQVPLSLQSVRAAFAEGDVDRSYALALELPASFERCAILLRAAREVNTLAAAQAALQAFAALASEEQQRVRNHALLSRGLDALTQLAAAKQTASGIEQPPKDWISWIRQLNGDKPWAAAVVVAETGAREWNLHNLLSDGEAIQELADLLLAERPDWAQIALRDSLPYFLEFCLSAGSDVRLKPIYENLFLAIAVDIDSSLPQAAALLQIIDYRLQIGIGASDYSEMLHQMSEAIRAIDSPSMMQLALDALETFISRPCASPEDRRQFAAKIISLLQRWRNRFNRAHQLLLRSIATELELGAIDTVDTCSDSTVGLNDWKALEGKRLAIYTLQESALRRAVTVLEQLCPTVRIDAFSDHVGGSASLQAASRNADIFVLATGAAKHAATIFIESRRPKSAVTLYATGQGSSSILQSLQQFVLGNR